MAIPRLLDSMCLALRASGLWLRYAAKCDPFLSLDCPPPWRNPRKGRDQILPSGNLGSWRGRTLFSPRFRARGSRRGGTQTSPRFRARFDEILNMKMFSVTGGSWTEPFPPRRASAIVMSDTTDQTCAVYLKEDALSTMPMVDMVSTG